MKKSTIIILAVFFLTGCGVKGYSPVVDNPGAGYQSDLEACRVLAEQRATGAEGGAAGAVIGAGLGAILGLGIGLIFDSDVGGAVAAGALGGATGGGVSSAAQANQAQKAIVVQCLQNRGHLVVGY